MDGFFYVDKKDNRTYLKLYVFFISLLGLLAGLFLSVIAMIKYAKLMYFRPN